MRVLDTVIFSLRNIRRGGTKALLCIIALCVGICSVLIVFALGGFAEETVEQELNQIGVRGMAFYTRDSVYRVEESHLEAVGEIEGVSAVMPLSLNTAIVWLKGVSSTAAVCGVSEEISDIFRLNLLYGRLPGKGDISSGARVIVVDDSLAESVYKRVNIVGKPLTLVIDGIAESFEVIGVIKSQKQGVENLVGSSIPSFLYVPHTAVNEMLGAYAADKIAVTCFSQFDAAEVAGRVENRLKAVSGIAFTYENMDQYTHSIKNVTRIVSLLATAVAGISIIVGGFGVMGAMVASVESRTREIGIYMALGAKRRNILALYLLEAQALCLTGAAAGLALCAGLLYGASAVFGFDIGFDGKYFLYCTLGACACGTVFGLMPAIRASRLNPIDAIREE